MNVNSAMSQVAAAVKAFQGQTKGKEFQVTSVKASQDDTVLEVTVKCVRRPTMVAEVADRILAVRTKNVPITALVFSKSSFDRLKQELQDVTSASLGVRTPYHTTYLGYRVLIDPSTLRDDHLEAL